MKKVKFFIVYSIIILIIMTCNGKKEVKNHEKEKMLALKTAEAWLILVDKGDYEKAWEQCSLYFKQLVTKEKLTQSLKAVRSSFGQKKKRSVKKMEYLTSVPGAPDGEYVVVKYETSFENKKNAIETITPMKDKDNKWRVSGYYIK